MKKLIHKYRSLVVVLCLVCIQNTLLAQTTPTKEKETSEQDSIPKLKYNFKNGQSGSLFLNLPSKKEIYYDTKIKRYVVVEKIGNSIVKTPVFLSTTEYEKLRLKQDINSYFKDKITALNSDKKGSEEAQKNLLPTYYVNSKWFSTIFGGNAIEVDTKGTIDVRLGVLYQNIENPQISEENRSNFTFDFDQQVTASISAKVGERLRLTANYDTKSTFDFQNLVKVEFIPALPASLKKNLDDRASKLTDKVSGIRDKASNISDQANKLKSFKNGFDSSQEDDILRKIELGNTNMNVSNNLISGSQSLFGLKTQLQFGKTTITSVFSQQKSETKTVAAQGGSTLNEFELQTTQYAANKHFFLAHYFRNNYNKALEQFPLINSPITITNLEVWVTNRTTNTDDVRNIVALTDLGEFGNDVYDSSITNITNTGAVSERSGFVSPDNSANSLGDLLGGDSGLRDLGTIGSTLPTGMIQGTDYTTLENAKKLGPNDYTFHPQLGILSLNRTLTDGDVLAVAFQYTLTGSDGIFKVGELSTDGVLSEQNLVVKLLRGELIQSQNRIWDLMMKNVYSLGAYQMQQEGFRLEIMYKDDRTGVPVNTIQNATTEGISTRSILNLTNLDILDQNNFVKPEGDGYFDYVEGVTVTSKNGTIMFPTLEPFGRDLEKTLTSTEDQLFVFKELYTSTQTKARVDFQNKDKFLLKGYYKSDASNGISLGAFNVPKGSVKVTSNGILLTEGVDYVVDYLSGRVQIINPSIEASGAPVQVSLENNTLFNQQVKRYIGIDVEHKFSDKFQMTGTYLNVNERPITQKVAFGSDPINNTMLGLSLNYDNEVPFLTKLVNYLPFKDTDAPSNFSVRADFAYLRPDTPSGIDLGGEATTYIDDFEGSQIPINLMDVNSWKLSSKPRNDGGFNFGNDDGLDQTTDEILEVGKKRAKLAWYSIDRLFYGGTLKPGNIDNNELSRPEVSRVEFSELFPETDLDIIQTNSLRTFDLAYFPKERGSYNYTTTAELEARPEDNWGGITRALSTTDFEKNNVEYIQFWIQDPYQNYSMTPAEGAENTIPTEEGELYFNLGNISEDVLKDSRKMFENGLPEANQDDAVPDETPWGNIPTSKSYLYTFTENDEDRRIQDVGLDGLNDTEENTKFNAIIGENLEDPSSDNYRFFRGSQYDAENASIISRYKDYNNTEGNSPTAGLSPENFPTSATTIPDTEDVNRDQTMNTIDAYYQYKVSLNRADLSVGRNNIVDVKTVPRRNPNGSETNVTWYQFRIPVATGLPVNGISDFNSIRFIRMFLTKFKSPVVLRFGQLQLVRGDWRRYTRNLHEGILDPTNDDLDADDLENFTTGVVNIEENERRNPIPYVLPPGIVREQLQGTTSIQFQNEQSLSVTVEDLKPNEARAVYKNLISDLRMFKRLKMFLHAEGATVDLEDDKMMAIVRLGADLNDNYYQIEIPLKATQFGQFSPDEVWPEANNMEVDLEALAKLKVERYAALGASGTSTIYPLPIDGEEPMYRMRVKGNPNLSNIKTLMMGVKNISNVNQSAEVWFNELRVAGFDNDGGWASVVNANANFADFADVALTGRMQTIGFGNVEQRVNERSQEAVKQYGFTTNVNIGQLAPKDWGVKIPMSYSISEEFKDPKFDQQFQDVKFDDAKEINENSKNSTDYTKNKSINFINVRKERTGELKKLPMPYDIENFSVSYSYNEQFHKDYNIEKDLRQDVRASASYAFSIPANYIEPFKKAKIFKSKYLKLIKDFNFNPLPTNIGVNTNITRNYSEQESRNLVQGLTKLPTLKQRNFLFDWDYTIGYNLTRALKVDFRAANKFIYDTFETDPDIDADEINLFSNFFNLGRASNYSQQLNATYKLPINKLPFLDFVTSDYTYSADFDWKAGSQSFIEQVGNNIQNANTHNISSNMNMKKFYKAIGLKKLFTLKKKGKKKVKKGDKPKFAPPTPKRAIGKSKKKKKFGEKFLDVTYQLLTSVKTIRASYSENNGTQLPGYVPEVGFLGRDQFNGSLAPSLGFVFGSQTDLRRKALENNWLSTRNVNYQTNFPFTSIEDDPYYARTYMQTHNNKFDINISVKPFKNDLDIAISANRLQTRNISEQIDPLKDLNFTTDTSDDFFRFGPSQASELGNFSMSYNMINTAFDGNGDATFQKFLDNIPIIQERLQQNLSQTSGLPADEIDGYGAYSQDVLLPAFAAAYSGKDAGTEGLKPFKNVPLPNWRITYKGLMKFKWIKKNFSNFTISHGYKSSYTIGNYSNNLQYREKGSTKIPEKDVNGNYFSKNVISNITVNDGFSPLIKVDLKLKNSLAFRGEVKKDRTLGLSFNNNSLSDVRGTEYIFGLGYRIKDLKIRSRIGGKTKTLKGNLNMKADISYRQNLTVIRTVDTGDTQVTAGQDLFSLKISADYNLSRNLIATFYYDQTGSKYAISTSFPRQSISTGINVTYNLGN